MSMVNIQNRMQAAYQLMASRKTASVQDTPRPFKSFAAEPVSTLFDQHSNHQMVSCIQSAAYLDRANAPAVGRADPPLHDVAIAVVVVSVVGIVRIIIIVVVISVGPIESVA